MKGFSVAPFLAGLLVLMLTSCYQGSTLEAAALRGIVENAPIIDEVPAQLEDIQLWRTLPWKNGEFVFYSAHDVARTPNEEHLGYFLLHRRGLGWDTKASGMMVRSLSLPAEGLVEYMVSGGRIRNADHASLVGRVFDPRVTAVEATFDTGQVLRDEPTNDLFAIVADGADAVCEVRVLAADGTVLERSMPDAPQQQCAP